MRYLCSQKFSQFNMKYANDLVFLFLLLIQIKFIISSNKRALQPSHELSQEEKWKSFFIDKKFEGSIMRTSLIDLVVVLSEKYLKKCTTILAYDLSSENFEAPFINSLLLKFGQPHLHGNIDRKNPKKIDILSYEKTCKVYVLFIEDVMDTNAILGSQNTDKVIIITKSSQWRVHEYLANRASQKIVNLLIISKSEMVVRPGEMTPYVLFTHKLYVDAIASSKYVVLTSWRNGRFTRPHLELFPKKVTEGFSGHRFTICLAHFPPFVIKRGLDSNDNIMWDGLEVRLVKLLGLTFNFTVDFIEAPNTNTLGSERAVLKSVIAEKSNLGISGIFVSNELTDKVDISNMLYQDCAAFMTLTSTALPRYRAILGPFHWTVWLSLTFVYLFAIFPLTFSYMHTLKPLLKNPEEMENMFWYVFGTFTNAFTFHQGDSWTNSDKAATRVFIGFYWLFTIIISACYTGSIIAFVTLPTYPETIDKLSQLLQGSYQIGALDKSDWVERFANSSEPMVEKLMRNVDLVPTVEEGVMNTTKAFFWPYAFLGSKANLDYIIRTQFVTKKKREILHVSNECLVSYRTAITYPKNSEYANILNAGVDRIFQSGFFNKIQSDVDWLMMRSSAGKLLAANKGKPNPLIVEDRALTLDDTQGMFLLLGIGFTLGGICLFFEIFGGCFNICKKEDGFDKNTINSNNSNSYDSLTPTESTNCEKSTSEIDSYDMNMFKVDNNRNVPNGRSDVSVEVSMDMHESANFGDLAGIERTIDNLFDFERYFGERNDDDLDLEERYLE